MRLLIFILLFAASAFSQMPAIEPGVSQELAKWRASQYSNISYKLNLTLEKMSPVLRGSIEIHVTQAAYACAEPNCPPRYIVLDWRKIAGHEKSSTISNVTINGKSVVVESMSRLPPPVLTGGYPVTALCFEVSDHLIFSDYVRMGENIIKLDFTSPILTSGSAITRYVDKEDGAEYIYSLFVPSDASTAFPVFDQPDLKARFSLWIEAPCEWNTVSNADADPTSGAYTLGGHGPQNGQCIRKTTQFRTTGLISTYVFAFAVGEFAVSRECHLRDDIKGIDKVKCLEIGVHHLDATRYWSNIYLRKSQAEKFKPHAAEVFRLNREAVKYLETYFDYKFPFPKYDLVLIPEFPFGGMEHAGATFLREQSVIFPQEPTKNDIISRANLIFHEAAHQWFGDTVTMKWFDDLWLKEGFATFMAYKALDKIMPEANAWKVFYERVKQAAYRTDSTRGTTAIYQPIANLSAAKSAYGNIVYNKAPAFLRQAEFYLGEQKFQTAVRAFLKKHEFANAGWEDLVKEFEKASGQDLKNWARIWVTKPGLPVIKPEIAFNQDGSWYSIHLKQNDSLKEAGIWNISYKILKIFESGRENVQIDSVGEGNDSLEIINSDYLSLVSSAPPPKKDLRKLRCLFPNFQDYGYGIFLLDDKSRDYVLKNIGREKDDFLRTMMWGSLWDSVREAELDPREYVELVIKNIASEKDEGTIQTLLSRVSTAMNYYLNDAQRAELTPKVDAVLIDKIQNASTQGQRITYYRSFLNIASTDKARGILKQILKDGAGTAGGNPSGSAGVQRGTPGGNPSGSAGAPRGIDTTSRTLPTGRVSASDTRLTLKAKDKFDIVTRLATLGDPDAEKLLANLEKTETSDDAKRYAYAAHAAFATTENKAKFWNDFINNKAISESWIEAAVGTFNSIQHSELTLPYLEKALAELPKLKRERKIFFVNDWLADFIGGQRDEKALAIVNKFLTDNPNLDKDLRLKVLENVDVIERAVKIRGKYSK